MKKILYFIVTAALLLSCFAAVQTAGAEDSNLAQGKTIFAWSGSDTPADAEALVNGKWDSFQLKGNPDTYDSPKWVIIDLGAPYYIGGVSAECVYSDQELSHLSNLTAYGAVVTPNADGTGKWEELASSPSQAFVGNWETDINNPRAFRYIKIYKPRTDFLCSELKVFEGVKGDAALQLTGGASEAAVYSANPEGADKLFDGKTDSNWGQSGGAEVIIDLKDSYFLGKAIVSTQFTDCYWHVSGFVISAAADGELSDETNWQVLSTIPEKPMLPYTLEFDTMKKYRYIKVAKPTNDAFLSELVFFEGTGFGDVAFGKTVSASTSPELIGTTKITGETGQWVGENQGPKWAVIDLENPFDLKEIQIDLAYDNVPYHISTVKVFGSNDPEVPIETSALLAQVEPDWTSKPDGTLNGWTNVKTWSEKISCPEPFRYLKIYRDDDGWAIGIKQVRALNFEKNLYVETAEINETGDGLTLMFDNTLDSDSIAEGITVINLADGTRPEVEFDFVNDTTYTVTINDALANTNYQVLVQPGIKATDGKEAVVSSFLLKTYFITGSVDGTGPRLKKIAADMPVGLAYTYKNSSGAAQEVMLILAVYQNNISVKTDLKPVEQNASVDLAVSFIAPENISGATVKGMLWNGQSLEPLMPLRTISELTH